MRSTAGSRAKMLVLSIVLACVAVTSAPAVQPDEVLPDSALEARARALSRELRCMVCQNQSIDDSDAPLARDLRLLVRERLKAGDSDADVLAFLTARYGDFVLLKPRLAWHTALLWAGPPILLITGALALFVVYRRRRAQTALAPAGGEPQALSAAEEARLAELTRPTQN
jgi:cytochrome c-type biogenesis protein CcmH